MLNILTTFASDTGVVVAAGATLSLRDPVTLADNVTVTKTGEGDLVILSPIAAGAGSTLNVGAGAAGIQADQNLAGLEMGETATLDIHDATVSLDYSGGASPYDQVAGWVNDGRIVSSLGDPCAAVGCFDIAAAESVIIKYTYKGDANCDGRVNDTDLNLLLSSWTKPGPFTWQVGKQPTTPG